jgi:ABC-2 type transport system ATP-binding protein
MEYVALRKEVAALPGGDGNANLFAESLLPLKRDKMTAFPFVLKPTEIALKFQRVSKFYGSFQALKEVNLEVREGECFGLVGVNGAGKTTLIKCLLDFCETDSGCIEIFGLDHRSTASRRRLAFLPERFSPPYYLTGRDFLAYLLNLRGLRYDQTQAKAMLAQLDLDPVCLSRPVRSYSKGMAQKLGLVGCFLTQRDLYVLDEPTSGLDPKARALFKDIARRLRAESKTIFFTSHSLPDVAETCDRIAVTHDGRVFFMGTPSELRHRYDNEDLEQAFLHLIACPS